MKFINVFLLTFLLALPVSVGGDSGTPQVAGQDVEPTPAVFTVDIQDECEVGELVRLNTSGEVDGITWKVKPETPDFEVIEEGRRAFFSARMPGEYLIIVAAARGGEPFLHWQTLTVRGEPTPVSRLTHKVGEWLKRLPADIDKSKIKQVAGVFRKLANSETAVDKMLEATALANSAVIGDELEKWVPFLDGLGNELDAMVASGDLSTREQYRAVWLEIAAAMERF